MNNKEKKHYLYLSYFMDSNTPLYGGEKGINIKPLNQIKKGDSANTKLISFHNHSGTHIDYPNHFINGGKPLVITMLHFGFSINHTCWNMIQKQTKL